MTRAGLMVVPFGVPQIDIGASTDARRSERPVLWPTMPASYAAIWCRASEPIAVGRVEVGSDALLLRGGRADADVAVPFEASRVLPAARAWSRTIPAHIRSRPGTSRRRRRASCERQESRRQGAGQSDYRSMRGREPRARAASALARCSTVSDVSRYPTRASRASACGRG